ncbi:unnamed protein product [Penicillium salamii]|nr:unnamed protein product [Penicillium salamii]CAG8319424.1 unnamed protein product [Penicillium salamii]CAG8322283.1 unnamed protein product [Penicillium salamii]
MLCHLCRVLLCKNFDLQMLQPPIFSRNHQLAFIMSAEKKRLRDRRSQQTLRDKKLKYTTKLKEQLAHCEQNHADHAVKRLLQVITGLRTENELLRQRQRGLKSLVDSWDEGLNPETPGYAWHNWPSLRKDTYTNETAFSLETGSNDPTSLNGPMTSSAGVDPIIESTSASSMRSPVQIHPSLAFPLADTTPLWCQIPPHSDDYSDISKVISCPWFSYPEKVTPCPDTPSSPLDILYGTKTNYLADMIHITLQRRPIRDPERLALGLLMYHLSRWFLSPSPATYDRLALFQRPVQGQMESPHPLVLDFLPWPRMRLNLIRHWHVYSDNRDDLFGMFACCVKIRWPWGEDILERDDQNELRIKKNFCETFMKLEGWGLTPEFTAKYPDLVEGMDLREITFELI